MILKKFITEILKFFMGFFHKAIVIFVKMWYNMPGIIFFERKI